MVLKMTGSVIIEVDIYGKKMNVDALVNVDGAKNQTHFQRLFMRM
jgi:hypothetical protein